MNGNEIKNKLENIKHLISRVALKSLLYEVSATPKPGLVDRHNNGAHFDMDFYSFLDSSVELSTYFNDIIDDTINSYSPGAEGHIIFVRLKEFGIAAEARMHSITGGVNTHKGAIYALGLLVAATMEIYLQHTIKDLNANKKCCEEPFDPMNLIESICQRAGQYVAPYLESEFEYTTKDVTYGLIQFQELGLKGARGEAHSGFESARKYGLPILEEGLTRGLSYNDAMVQALMNIMMHLEDSNVIGRHDLIMLRRSQKKAEEIIKNGGMYTEQGQNMISRYDTWCIKHHISHGGSADLLSVSVFLQIINKELINCE